MSTQEIAIAANATVTIAVGKKTVEFPIGTTPTEFAKAEASMTTVKRWFEAVNPNATVRERKAYQAEVAKCNSNLGRLLQATAEQDKSMSIAQTRVKRNKDGEITGYDVQYRTDKTEAKKVKMAKDLAAIMGIDTQTARAKLNESVKKGLITI